MSDKPSVPRTPVAKSVPIKFNMRRMVLAWFQAKLTASALYKENYTEKCQFFEGIAIGYQDWFEVLKVPREMMDEIIMSFDKKAIQEQVEYTVKQIINTLPDQRRIIIPGEDINNRDTQVVRDIFQTQIGKIGERIVRSDR